MLQRAVVLVMKMSMRDRAWLLAMFIGLAKDYGYDLTSFLKDIDACWKADK